MAQVTHANDNNMPFIVVVLFMVQRYRLAHLHLF